MELSDHESKLKVLEKGILPIIFLYKDHPATSMSLFNNLITLWCNGNEDLSASSVMVMQKLLIYFDSDHQEKCFKVG